MTRKTKQLFVDCILVILASGSWVLSFPVAHWKGFVPGPFLFQAIAYFLIKNRSSRSVFVYFAIISLAVTVIGAQWLINVHRVALLLAVGYKMLIILVIPLGAQCIRKLKHSIVRTIYWGLLWVIYDALNHAGSMSFPYLCFPYSFTTSGLGLEIASIGSMYALSFCTALSGAGILELYEAYKTNHHFTSFLALGCSALLPFFFLIPPHQAISNNTQNNETAQTLNVALIQPNYYSFTPKQKDFEITFTLLSQLTQQAALQKPNLIVWHETALVPPIFWYAHNPADPAMQSFSNKVLAFMRSIDTPILTGITWIDQNDTHRTQEYNGALLINRGAPIDVYKKMQLVPFAEYFPYSKTFPGITRWLIRLFGPLRAPGTVPTVFSLSGFRFAAPICFEDSYLSVFARFNNVACYIVLTEDSWSQSIALKRQHLDMSQMRAAETGTWVIRASNSGITAAIDNKGRIVTMLEPDTQGILITSIPIQPSRKSYFWFLYIPWFALAGIIIIIVLTLLCPGNTSRSAKNI